VLPQDGVRTMRGILTSGYDQWNEAVRKLGGQYAVHDRMEAFNRLQRGENVPEGEAVEAVRTVCHLLRESGVELPPWIEPHSENE